MSGSGEPRPAGSPLASYRIPAFFSNSIRCFSQSRMAFATCGVSDATYAWRSTYSCEFGSIGSRPRKTVFHMSFSMPIVAMNPDPAIRG